MLPLFFFNKSEFNNLVTAFPREKNIQKIGHLEKVAV